MKSLLCKLSTFLFVFTMVKVLSAHAQITTTVTCKASNAFVLRTDNPATRHLHDSSVRG
jgi:hypothetical protein